MNLKKSFCFLMFLITIVREIGVDCSLYIKPSLDASCHNQENCLTLSQFAANDSWLRKDNTTLLLLPSSTANHTLDLTLNISDITNFSMLSYNKSKIYIICQQEYYVSLSFTDVEQVWLRGVRFIACGINAFLSVKQIKVENCTFQGKENSGTAMVIYDSNAFIYKTNFISNRVGFCMLYNAPTNMYGGV